MAIPSYQGCMLPALEALGDGKEAHKNSVIERAARYLNITSDELKEEHSRSRNPIFANRVGWAIIDLKFAGLIKSPRRGVFQITVEGRKLLDAQPQQIHKKFLMENYELYRNSQTKDAKLARSRKTRKKEDEETEIEASTPEEMVEQAASKINTALEADLLERVHQAPPAFLERLVIDLLGKMGYGGGDPEMGSVTGKPGDGGIDGKIKEDALGLDEVYVQAKRYDPEKVVGVGDLRNFVGAIDGEGVNKGVFVTTAKFNSNAKDFASKTSKRIILIDGKQLAQLMVENGVGVREKTTIEIKRLDEDYFDFEGGS